MISLRPTPACLVLEVKERPPVEIAEKVANACAIKPQDLTLILTPTTSLCGAVQVVARSLEVSLHRVHTLGFPLSAIVDGMATAPVCPPSKDLITAMGRTNDAIMYGGYVKLFVDCGDSEAEDLARKLPSNSSRDYGKPFAETFKDYKYNFYAIDPGLFSPARITISSVRTGKTYHAGPVREAMNETGIHGIRTSTPTTTLPRLGRDQPDEPRARIRSRV